MLPVFGLYMAVSLVFVRYINKYMINIYVIMSVIYHNITIANNIYITHAHDTNVVAVL
jgi:hypothetical protein